MAWTDEYVGVPYAIHGRDMNGLDCWGLVRSVYQSELGIALPCYANDYVSAIDEEGLGNAYAIEMEQWDEQEEPAELDVVWCMIAGMECHCGIYLQGHRMLHAMQGVDSHIVDLNKVAWQRRVQKWYRLPR